MPLPRPAAPANLDLRKIGRVTETRSRGRASLAFDSKGFTTVLGLLAALPALSIDISQPILLATQRDLGSSLRQMGLTLTLFMVGFAAGQFSAGPLSDRFGRRPPVVLALLAYVAAGLACALATQTQMLVGARLLQGVAAGACVVLAFAMVRDVFEGEAARIKRSYVTTIVSLAPVLAPSIGAYILSQWGWRPVYGILAAGGALLSLAIVYGLRETRPPGLFGAVPLLAAYRVVLSDRRFVLPVAVNALGYGCIFAYIAGSPAVLIGELSLTPAGYGLFFACTALALTAGSFASARGGKRGFSSYDMSSAGLVGSALATAVFAIVVVAGALTVPIVLVLMAASSFCRGLAAPNVQHIALEPMAEHAGTAAAAMGVLQILTAAVSSAAVTLLLPVLGAGAMSHVMAALACSAVGVWYLGVRNSQRP